MKEATGELNMAIVVVLAISILIAFFYYTVWPVIHQNFEKNSQCSKAICNKATLKDGYVECHLKNDETVKFKCVYKG